MSALPTRRIGDLTVSAIGMGAMTLTQVPGYAVVAGMRTVHAALDAGVTLFDTADSYGPTGEYGINEAALVGALRSYRRSLDDVVIATKGGHTRHENATWWIDGSADHIAKAARDSLRRLGLESIPLYQHHRPDPRRPYEESMTALRDLHSDGIVQRVGVSNVSRDQLLIAHGILGDTLVSVQNEYSPGHRNDEGVIDLAGKLGIAFLAWGPLGGMKSAKTVGAGSPEFGTVAHNHGVSPQQVAIAWALHRAPHLIPIPGASRPESIIDSARATTLNLTVEELALLDRDAQ